MGTLVRNATDFVHVRSWSTGLTLSKVVLVLLLLGPPVLRRGRFADTAFENPFAELDVTYLLHLGVWAFSGLYIGVLLLRSRFFTRYILTIFRTSPARWYVVFMVLATLSVLYSVYPLYTIFFAGKLWIVAFLAVRVAQEARQRGGEPLDELINTIFAAYITGFLLLSVLFLIDPDLVSSPTKGIIGIRLTGGFLGDYGVYSLFTLVGLGTWYFYHSKSILARYLGLLLLVWPLYLLLLAQTRTTLLGAVVAFLLIIRGMRSQLRRNLWLASIGLLIVLMFILSRDLLYAFLARGQDTRSLLSLSGRRYMFEYMLEWWRESPFIGFGFQAGSRHTAIRFLKETGLNMGSAHDSLSKVLVDLGLLGTFVLGLAFAVFWRRVWTLRRTVRRDLWVRVAFLGVHGLLSSITSGGIAEPSALWPVMFVAPTFVNVRKGHASLRS